MLQSRGCAGCPLPADVARMRSKMLTVERESVNGAASMKATEKRLEDLVAVLGRQLGDMAAMVAEIKSSLPKKRARK